LGWLGITAPQHSQHNDTQENDTLPNGLKYDTQYNGLNCKESALAIIDITTLRIMLLC
jgi:hypothetical protein